MLPPDHVADTPASDGDDVFVFPASFAQRRLWFLDQLAPGTPAYNLPAALHLHGILDRDALGRCLHALVARHEALRTTFAVDREQGEPLQVISPELRLPLPQLDLAALPPDERATAAQQHMRDQARQPFDLQRGPLLRALLLRLTEQEHVLVLTMHHIIGDAWSRAILLRELVALYATLTLQPNQPLLDAEALAQRAQLPPLPVQYADYAVWQREALAGPVRDEQLAYWRQQLAGAPPLLELPTDYARPAVQGYNGATHSTLLPPPLVTALQTIGQQHGATLFMVLLAAFQTLLSRYTGQDDLVVGTPAANRSEGETANVIGLFVNTLVLRTDVGGNPRFVELLRRVREVTLQAYAHQDVPFELVVDELRPARHLSYTPLYQVLCVLHSTPLESVELSGLQLRPGPIESGLAQCDLMLTFDETADGLLTTLEYNTDLFRAETIARMATHLELLLAGIAADPQRRLHDRPLLTAAEQPQAPPPLALPLAAATLHQVFAAQAARTPDAVAVVGAGGAASERLSYSELNARADRLAQQLRGLGVGPDVLVGLCLERTPTLLIGILGILKAGGAYVPLDPSYPAERIRLMLDDAQVIALVTQGTLREHLLERGLPVVDLDAPELLSTPAAPDRAEHTLSPDNLAYVIYTSGSTGRPKGVPISHRQVLRLFAATADWFHFTAQDVWTLFHSAAFDFSVWEIWGALLHGGRLVVVPTLTSRAPDEFRELLRTEQVTVLNQTPSAFGQLMQADAAHSTADDLQLRLVIFGGEALDIHSFRPWFERHGARPQLVNMYGITETTVHVTYRPLTPADLDDNFGSAIGGAMPDLRVYVLDRYLQPVPVGAVGELYVGGAGVGRGYLNRPALTAERFLPDPWNRGGRMYRSGDLVRRLADELVYLGRIDQQVKLRGFRIELGEIEAALLRHPAIREATVIAREDVPGDRRLVAYVVTGSRQPEAEHRAEHGAQSTEEPASQKLVTDHRSPTTAALRAFLQQSLPAYMLPSAFVVLDALPLTPNGKLDRRALPAPDAAGLDTQPPREGIFVAPRTPTEATVAAICAELLGLPQVSADAHFFEIGGHSLLAAQAVTRLRAACGVTLPLRALFETPTVAGLAEQIELARWAAQASAAASSTAAISDEEEEGEL